jgi:hypothetical protein
LSYQLNSYVLEKVLHELSNLFKISTCREICAY